jgi:hypothetical protein
MNNEIKYIFNCLGAGITYAYIKVADTHDLHIRHYFQFCKETKLMCHVSKCGIII